MEERYLKLENGQIFKGKAFGAQGTARGSVAVANGVTGLSELLTDPALFGKILLLTFPLIGNFGVNPEDFVSDRAHICGVVVREHCLVPSNFRTEMPLEVFLREQGIPGIYDVDTREIAQILRESENANACITGSV